MKTKVEETEKIGFDQQNPSENPLENVLKGIFSNLQGDPNDPEATQELDLDGLAELGKVFVEGLGLGKALKDAAGVSESTEPSEAAKTEPKNICVHITIGDIRFK